VITRRSVVLAGGIGLLVAHRLGRGQPAATIRRVGWLSFGSKRGLAHVYAAFKQGMLDLGWLEGKNVQYHFVYADGDVDRLGALAGELIGRNVEVIICGNALATRAAQRATKTIPIVMVYVGNPVGNGFVASLANPGGNITGMTQQPEEVLGKLIGILHEIVPGARRIAILLNESNPNYPCSGAPPSAPVPRWTSLRFGFSPAHRHNSALPSNRSFGSDHRPSWWSWIPSTSTSA